MQEQLVTDKYMKIHSSTKRIDFTSKLLCDNLNLMNIGEQQDDDVLWWGLCLVTFNCVFNDECRDEFIETLKKEFIHCSIIDNHSVRQFLMSFDILGDAGDSGDSSLVNRGILLRKGIHPCIQSVAESRPDINWYHLASMSDEKRNRLAFMYKRIYALFSDKIISIEIVRDLYEKDYLLI